MVLRDYSQHPIPIGAKVELEVEWQVNRVTAPVYLWSDSIVRGEPLLLGTNVVISLGLMIPGPGVKPRESLSSQPLPQEEPNQMVEEQPLTVPSGACREDPSESRCCGGCSHKGDGIMSGSLAV